MHNDTQLGNLAERLLEKSVAGVHAIHIKGILYGTKASKQLGKLNFCTS